MSNLKKIPIEQTTLSNDFTNTYKSEVDTAYTNNHTHSNKTMLDAVSGSNTGDETLSTILTKVCANKVTCSTDSTTTEKAVTLSGFSLISGVTVKVTFTNANTADSPTLNVNSSGAKAIYSEDGNAVIATNPFYVPAGATVEFTYDGTNWVYKNRVISNYINGNSWYRIWTNGYIEQGGQLDFLGGAQSITFLIPFKNINYYLNRSNIYVSYANMSWPIYDDITSFSNTDFVVQQYAPSYGPFKWEAKGF